MRNPPTYQCTNASCKTFGSSPRCGACGSDADILEAWDHHKPAAPPMGRTVPPSPIDSAQEKIERARQSARLEELTRAAQLQARRLTALQLRSALAFWFHGYDVANDSNPQHKRLSIFRFMELHQMLWENLIEYTEAPQPLTDFEKNALVIARQVFEPHFHYMRAKP